jgi:hypothetical protein
VGEHEGIDAELRDWIERQPMFFVGTAPRDPDAHVNVSPKGPAGSLRVLDPNTVAYLDVVGSGAETIAHLRDSGRIVVMLCAFDEAPRVLRLHGRGEVVAPQDQRFAELLGGFRSAAPDTPGVERAIVVVAVNRIDASPGRTVPLMEYGGERPHLRDWAEEKGPDALRDYQRSENAESIDGLPAVDWIADDREGGEAG